MLVVLVTAITVTSNTHSVTVFYFWGRRVGLVGPQAYCFEKMHLALYPWEAEEVEALAQGNLCGWCRFF